MHDEAFLPEHQTNLVELSELIKIQALGIELGKQGINDMHDEELFEVATDDIDDNDVIFDTKNVIRGREVNRLREDLEVAQDKSIYVESVRERLLSGNLPEGGFEELVFVVEQDMLQGDVAKVREMFNVTRENILMAGDLRRLTRLGVIEKAISQTITEANALPEELPILDLLGQAREAADTELIRSLGAVLKPELRKSVLADDTYPLSLKAQLAHGQIAYTRYEDIVDASDVVKEVTNILKEAVEDRTSLDSPRTLKLATKLVSDLPFTYAKDIFVDQIGSMATDDPRLPRLLREFNEIDPAKAGKLTRSVLGSPALNPRMFRYLSELLVVSGTLSENFRGHLDAQEERTEVQSLLSKYPFEANTIIDTLASMDTSEHTNTVQEHMTSIDEVVQKLGGVTPKIYRRYLELPIEERDEFVQKIKSAELPLFKNIPLESAIPEDMLDLKDELIYLAYLPTSLSFNQTVRLLEQVPDCSEQLKRYKIPENGFEFELAEKSHVLGNGKTLDVAKLGEVTEMLSPESTEIHPQTMSGVLRKITNSATQFTPQEMIELYKLIPVDVETSSLLDTPLTEESGYAMLQKMRYELNERFGQTYKDTLSNYLVANPDLYVNLQGALSKPGKIEQLKRNLSDSAQNVDWDTVLQSEDGMALALSEYIGAVALKPYKTAINKNIKNYIEGPGKRHKLRAYISKTQPAFLSRASIGLSSGEDTDLFMRDDYFQFTVVEDETTVVANIQAYTIKDPDGNPSLLMRGFNPTNEVLARSHTGTLCEQSLQLGRRFAEDNGLSHVYVTDQKRFQALSNKDGVTSYMSRRYLNAANQRSVDFPITSTKRMDTIYQIPSI